MSLLTQVPAVAEKLGEAPAQPDRRRTGAGMAGPAAGDRAPDAPLVAAKGGASLRHYNLFAEHRHVLLLLGDGHAAHSASLSGKHLRTASRRPARDIRRRLCRS